MAQCTVCGTVLPEDATACPSCGTAVGPRARSDDEQAGGQATASTWRATVADYGRDAAAAGLLLVSLFLAWVTDPASSHHIPEVAAARLDVLLVTLATAGALCIPRLGRAGVFGRPWGPEQVRRARLLITAPYGALVLVYLVLALVAQLTLGPAFAFGLAGAILVAQPRRCELPESRRDDRIWVLGTLVISGLAVIFTLVQIAEMFAIFSANGPAAFILSIILGLSGSVVLAFVAGGAITGHRAWRRVGIGLGIVAAVLTLLSLNPQVVLVNATVHGPAPTFSLTFWIAFGAAAAAPALTRRQPSRGDEGAEWFSVARASLALAICAGILLVVVAAIELLYQQAVGRTTELAATEWMIALAVGVLLTAGAVTVWAIDRTQTRAAVQATSIFAAILFLLGLILVVIWSLPDALPFAGAGTLAPLIAFALPFALLGSLWIPQASRERYAALPRAWAPVSATAHVGAGEAQVSGDAESAQLTEETADAGPVDEATATQAETLSATRPIRSDPATEIAEAADPATPARRLHELAATAPHARAALAGNPATYPALVEWLGRLGDPEIDAVLAARPERSDNSGPAEASDPTDDQ